MIQVLFSRSLEFLVHSAARPLLPPTLLFPQQESIFAAVLLLYRVSVSGCQHRDLEFCHHVAITYVCMSYEGKVEKSRVA